MRNSDKIGVALRQFGQHARLIEDEHAVFVLFEFRPRQDLTEKGERFFNGVSRDHEGFGAVVLHEPFNLVTPGSNGGAEE